MSSDLKFRLHFSFPPCMLHLSSTICQCKRWCTNSHVHCIFKENYRLMGSHVLFVTYMLFFVYQFQSAGTRTVTAEGLCKLLLNNRIKSPNLVSRLLIMWYNPVTGILVLFTFYFEFHVLQKQGTVCYRWAHFMYVCFGKTIAESKWEKMYKEKAFLTAAS
jgi:hypothetical protein